MVTPAQVLAALASLVESRGGRSYLPGRIICRVEGSDQMAISYQPDHDGEEGLAFVVSTARMEPKAEKKK